MLQSGQNLYCYIRALGVKDRSKLFWQTELVVATYKNRGWFVDIAAREFAPGRGQELGCPAPRSQNPLWVSSLPLPPFVPSTYAPFRHLDVEAPWADTFDL